MRKRPITPIPQDAPHLEQGWLDLDRMAVVEVTSEKKDYPVESALISGEVRGWRAADSGTQTIRPLLGGSHRLHRNGISGGCARNFGLLPSQLVEFVQRGFVRGIEGVNLVANYQSVLSAFLHADTNAGCGRNPTLRVFSTAHGIANLSGKGLGAVRSHAWHNSQSRAQHHRRYPNLQHPQTRHKSSSCFPLLRLGRG